MYLEKEKSTMIANDYKFMFASIAIPRVKAQKIRIHDRKTIHATYYFNNSLSRSTKITKYSVKLKPDIHIHVDMKVLFLDVYPYFVVYKFIFPLHKTCFSADVITFL